jgi:hypothetical protein
MDKFRVQNPSVGDDVRRRLGARWAVKLAKPTLTHPNAVFHQKEKKE